MSIRPWLVLAGSLALAVPSHAADPHLQNDIQKFSYIIGLNIARSLSQQGITKVDAAAIALAIDDATKGVPPRISQEDMEAAQAAYRKALQDEQRDVGQRNLKDGEEFLAANAKREGVIALESGVQYRVLKEGEGKLASVSDTVVVHYAGKLLDGREFDSSFSRNEPLTMPLSGVISGWQQVVSRMKEGTTVETWIPSKHGYGERGAGKLIGPNATLHFKIELIAVKTQ